MPQVQKPEVRERILGAAAGAFAREGYVAATMQGIAREAGMAAANVYRYFDSKEALFDAVVPPALVSRFERLLERSVRAHAQLAGVTRGEEQEDSGGRELLEFWIEHRLAVVILLGRSSGSVHAGFGERFVARLLAVTLAELRAAHPGLTVPREARLVLEQIFENTRRMIGAILEACSSEHAIRQAVAAFRSYQVAGLAGFARWLVEHHAPRERTGHAAQR